MIVNLGVYFKSSSEERIMGLIQARHAPGKIDISEEFSYPGIWDTLSDYEKLGRYEFGDLTATHCKLDPGDKTKWKKLIAHYYPADVQAVIKAAIILALTNKDSLGDPFPVPIKFIFDATPAGTVNITYNPSGPEYTIVLGYPGPLSMRLAERREKAKSKGSDRKEK
jgi:hypothetical protein